MSRIEIRYSFGSEGIDSFTGVRYANTPEEAKEKLQAIRKILYPEQGLTKI